MRIDRDFAAGLALDTIQILHAGSYRAPSGRRVAIGVLVEQAVRGTIAYPPDVSLAAQAFSAVPSAIAVSNETTLEAAQRWVETGQRVAALNFASATHPGGGFLAGARAKEESLARSSGLYACLEHQPMYGFHRARHDPLYTDYVIYSPDVPVFRTDAGALLEVPYLCSFITSAAANAYAARNVAPDRVGDIGRAMQARIHRVLTVATLHPPDVLILGAWGCGAFGNDPRLIAGLFREALTGPFADAFPRVIFAITDWSADRRFIGPFADAFSHG